MNSIVLPTDFSELANEALPWARKMAEAFDARVHCLHIVREPQYFGGGLEMVLPDPTLTEGMVANATKRLRSYAETELRDWADRVITEVRVGTPFIEIIRYAREVQATMIVMSTHGHSALAQMLVGSTTEAVVRKASCPVFSIRSPGLQFEMP